MVFPMDGAVMPPAEPEQPQLPLTVYVCRDGIELREVGSLRLVRSYRNGEEVPQAMLDRIQGEPVMCMDRDREEDVFSVEALGRLLGGQPNRNGDVFSQEAIAGSITRQAMQDAIDVLSRQGARSDAEYWAGIHARRQARQDRLRAEAAAHTIGVNQAGQPVPFMGAAWEVTVTRPEQEPAVHRFADPQFIGQPFAIESTTITPDPNAPRVDPSLVAQPVRDPVHSYPQPCTLCGHDAVQHAGAPCSVQGCHCPRYRNTGENMSSLYQTLNRIRDLTPETGEPVPTAGVRGRTIGIRVQNSWGEEGDHARRIEVVPGAPFDQAFTDALGVPPVEQTTPYRLDQQRGWPTPASLDFTAQVEPTPTTPADRVAHVAAQAAMNEQIFDALANPHMEAEAQAAAVEHARQQVTRCRFCQHAQSSHGDDGSNVDRGCRVPGCNCSQFRVRSYDDTPRRIMPPLTPPPLLEQQAADAVNEFTRNRMRENGFFSRIMPPAPVDDYDELDLSVTNRADARAQHLAREIVDACPAWGNALLEARRVAGLQASLGFTGLDTVDYDLIVNRMLCYRAEQAGQSPAGFWQTAGQIARQEDRQEITPQERFTLAPSDSLLDHFVMERQRLQRASVRRREEYQQIQQARARANELLDLIERDRLAYNSAMLELQQQGMEFYERVQHHLVIEARVRGGEWMHRNNWGYIDEEPLRAAAWAREVAQEIMARPGDPMQSGRLVEMRDEHPNRARLVEEQITLLQVQASSARHAQVVEPVAAEAAGRFLGMTVTEQERQLRAIRERNPALARRIAALVDHARHERGEEVLPRTYETVGPAVGNTAGLQRIQLENGSGFTYGMTPRLLRADFSSAADPEPQPAASTEDPMVQAREKLIRLLETPPPPLPTPVQFENIQLGSYPVNRDGAWEAAMEQILNNMGVPADVLQGTGGSTTQINFNDIRPRGEPIAASRSVDYGAGATAGDMTTRVQEMLRRQRPRAQALLLNQRTLADLQSWARQPGNLPDEARQSFLRDGLPEMFGAQLIVTENLPDGRVVIRERQDAQPMNEVNRNLTQLRRSINNIQNALNLPASPETTPATPPEEPRN